jgi:hypothetical protein
MLVVHLKVRDMDVVVGVGRRLLLDALEELLAGPRNQARLLGRTHHGITLSRSRLSIRKDTCVVSVEVVVQELFSERSIDVLLVGVCWVVHIVGPEGLVEGELLVFMYFARIGVVGLGRRLKGRLLRCWVHTNETLRALLLLCVESASTLCPFGTGPISPLFRNALHRTTTLTLPGPSFTGGGAMKGAKRSTARREGAEAIVLWRRLEYMRGSIISASSQEMSWWSCCARSRWTTNIRARAAASALQEAARTDQ